MYLASICGIFVYMSVMSNEHFYIIINFYLCEFMDKVTGVIDLVGVW
jgi:hypothetical protein